MVLPNHLVINPPKPVINPPNHPVINSPKPQKVRRVRNAAAKY